MRRVLIVEDDQAMAIALRDGFEYEGFSVEVARDGEVGSRMASENEIDLIILDVMLPKLSGFDVCKQLRSAGKDTPVIMLTSRSQEIDKVLGLRIGADDYVTKPFSFVELMARVDAVLRRWSAAPQKVLTYEFGDITLNFDRFEATRAGESLDLSTREFTLLRYFVEHRGEAITREQLLGAVWGYSAMALTRTVDMHVAKLRQKIEASPSDPRYILTVHRVGYKFAG